MIGKILFIAFIVFILIMFIINSHNVASVPEKCSECKHCKFTDKYDNGLPIKYCEKNNTEILNTNLNRPNGWNFGRYCSDFEPKEKK